MLLARKEYEKIPEVFDHKYDLQMLYPKRKKFHISEVANFLGVMGLYFAEINQLEAAEMYNYILQDVASDFPIAKQLNRKLNPGIIHRLLMRMMTKNSAKD